ncbi:uncharacterized protein SCHCODRAFT_02630977 [Schizophyllum commune H4-8]|nr:uncharacterized protein SCHCODRAFT_02630977 [Schizophyllum commune H4-8]KAI5890142.1 hypothetical protein SCHCODRAFT_02630977 [Schizophyllum commune H4-8]
MAGTRRRSPQQHGSSRKQPNRSAKQRAARDQLEQATKESATQASQQSASRRAAARSTDPLIAATERMVATLNGTLAPGEQPAEYAYVYQYLPPYLAIPAGTPMTTALKATVTYSPLSEEVMRLMFIAECGSVEAGMEQARDVYANSDIRGGNPDPEDTTLQLVDIPGQSYHMRFWQGHQDAGRSITFQFCDNKTRQPRRRPRGLRVYFRDTLNVRREIKSEEYIFGAPQLSKVASESFVTYDGYKVELVVNNVAVKMLRMPCRATESQPATPLEELPLED